MKKTIGIVLMVIGGIFFALMIATEVRLANEGRLPTQFAEWIGNLILPVTSVLVILLGNYLRKK